MIEFRHLRYFVVLAEELHFGRAAERLHIAQPGLSQQIQGLEAELGVSLLNRTRRRVELTSAGIVLLEEGRRVLSDLERAVTLTQRTGQGEIGRLRIGAAESAMFNVLPDLVRQYRRDHAAVHLVVREMTSPSQIAALRTGDIDIGFIRSPIDSEGLASITIRREEAVLLLPERHALAKLRRVPLVAVAREPIIIHPASPRPSWADFMISVCRAAGFEPIIGQEAIEMAAVVAFVAAGLGVTLVPESATELDWPGVVARPVSKPAPITELQLVYQPGSLSPTARDFVSLARRRGQA